MNTFTDNQPYNIEAAQKLFIQYSHDINFDYSTGKYPSGNEPEWDWENQYIPIPHYVNGTLVDKCEWMRIRVGTVGIFTIPIRIAVEGEGIPEPVNDGYVLSQVEGESVWVNPAVFAGSDIQATLPIEFSSATSTVSHSDGDGYKHVPIGGNDLDVLTTDGSGVYGWVARNTHTHVEADITDITFAQGLAASALDADLEIATGAIFTFPDPVTITEVFAKVGTAPTGGAITIDVTVGGVSMFSTLLTIDVGEKTSLTAAIPPVISTANISKGDEVIVEITQPGIIIAGKDLTIYFNYNKQ